MDKELFLEWIERSRQNIKKDRSTRNFIRFGKAVNALLDKIEKDINNKKYDKNKEEHMSNIIDFIPIIENNLKLFNYLKIEVVDYKGNLHTVAFSRGQYIAKKCVEFANYFDDGHDILSMKCYK